MALAERYRLRSRRSFSQVYKRGRKAHGHCLVARALVPAPVMTNSTAPGFQADGPRTQLDASREVFSGKAFPDRPYPSEPSSNRLSRRVSARGDFALSGTRFGISISRKVSKKAVVRNRIKRQIRAALITLMPGIKQGYWVVITVRSVAISCEYDDFLRELRKVLTALEVLHGD